MEKTINSFIKELQAISEEKKKSSISNSLS